MLVAVDMQLFLSDEAELVLHTLLPAGSPFCQGKTGHDVTAVRRNDSALNIKCNAYRKYL